MGCCSLSSMQFLTEAGVFSDTRALFEAAGLDMDGAPVPPPNGEASHIDTILYNGTFLLATPPPDHASEHVSAVAISRGTIVDVGDAARIRANASPKTHVVDLHGATVSPGFIEAHAHLVMALQGIYSVDLRYPGCKSYDAVLQTLRDAVQAAVPGADGECWVFGQNFDPSLLEFRMGVGFPQLGFEQLDPISSTVNIFVMNASGHIAYGNTKAFDTVQVKSPNDAPPGSRYGTNAAGELNGVMFEPPSFGPFMKHVPKDKVALETIPAMLDLLKDAQHHGITTWHDPAIGVSGSLKEMLEVYRAISVYPLRPVDLVGSIDLTSLLGDPVNGPLLRPVDGLTAPALPGENGSYHELVVPRLKLWTDGSTQGYTGYLSEEYLLPVTPAGLKLHGEPDWTPAQLATMLTQAKAQNWGVLMHANGDAAVELALDAVETVYGTGSKFLNRIEHCTLASPEQYDRMLALGVAVTYLVNHVHIWGHTFAENIIGPERAARLDAAADALARGILYSYHCDYSTSLPDPLQYMETAVTRRTSNGTVLGPHQAITPLQALEGVTINPAKQLGLDGDVGTIEVGKFANLVQLGKDPTRVPHTEIASIPVEATWLRGREIRVSRPLEEGVLAGSRTRE